MITRQDWIDANLDVTPALQERQINRFIRQSILFDLPGNIENKSFYNLLINESRKNPIEQKWVNVLEPYSYTYEEGNYSHQGIKLCLVYWSYARYLKYSDIASTPFGASIKTSEFTQPLQQKKINEIVSDYNRAGDSLYLDVRFYLERFVDEFTAYSENLKDDKDLIIQKVAGPGASYPEDYRSSTSYNYY